MARRDSSISDDHRAFIEAAHMFFVATAGAGGRVNISPKGTDSLRVTAPDRIVWLNLTGSGNETAAHVGQVNRMTLMWCGFGKRPLILRAYGTARVLHERDDGFEAMTAVFGTPVGARQVFDMQVDLVQSSCGFAVPFMDFVGERDVLDHWAEDKGRDGVRAYWDEKNRVTIDGAPTGVVPGDEA